MQLILNTETDIGIQRKMSAIEQESFDEKFITNAITEKVDDEIPNINEDSVEDNIVESLKENKDFEKDENSTIADEMTPSECIDDASNEDHVESNCPTDMPEICDDEKQNDDICPNMIIEDEDYDNGNSIVEEQKEETEKETDLQLGESDSLNEMNQEAPENDTNADTNESIINEVNKQLQDVLDEVATLAKTDIINEITSSSVLNGDNCVISIPDEKEEQDITITENISVEEKSKPLDAESDESDLPADNENSVNQISENNECLTQDDEEKDVAITIKSSIVESIADKDDVNSSEEIERREDKEKNLSNNNGEKEKQIKPEEIITSRDVKDTKKPPLICKLSNTLDILSDEEEEEERPEKESQNNSPSSDEKQCINIEDDDDDIMLINEEITVKDEDTISETNSDVKEWNESPACDDLSDQEPMESKDISNSNQDNTNVTETDTDKMKQEVKPVENKPIQKSLLSLNFLKSSKKNLADMTRDELEEFCILKIVESVVDRSNLNEIQMQLKKLSQNIEEHKKKAMQLSKQNRDLQVVLKSVQEEQKIRSDGVTPLKITRSVGMQVVMTDQTPSRRPSTLTPNSAQNNAACNKSPNRLKKQKSQKKSPNPNNTQQIPVPRLVPAVSSAIISKLQPTNTNNATKSPVSSNLPNGLKNFLSTLKPEKRPHGKMQGGNSITVDLTDDEPPTKIMTRIVNPPVRLVSPQNLLAPQRQAFCANINSPRKVYIPISGSQNQVRPGQTIMLKPMTPQGPRHRVPQPLPKPNSAIRMSRITSRHPAPLPDCMKQYQPPNWKALPPAPELKLSKVDNGIVISWKILGYQHDNHEEIASYQLYAYQESSLPPSTALWKKIGDVKALPLPMACTLTQFMSGFKYYFAVRAVDIRSRIGPFSAPGNIFLFQ